MLMSLWFVLVFAKISTDSTITKWDFKPPQFQERESELAHIRNRFQKGNNMWKNKDEEGETNKNVDIKVSLEASGTKPAKCVRYLTNLSCFQSIYTIAFNIHCLGATSKACGS